MFIDFFVVTDWLHNLGVQKVYVNANVTFW